MSNMSYCRFQNTSQNLSDCVAHMEDTLSEDEAKARLRLIRTCQDIVDEYGEHEDED